MKLLCFLGIHSWRIVKVDETEYDFAFVTATCRRCAKRTGWLDMYR